MLVSYYRQISITPEALTQEVGGSLRTSYDWDMLRRFRQHYIFREVSLPSNLSFVPPASDWHQWLSQFGPLWITVSGDPSHAVVVSGISGDLTPSGTYVHILNPWDTRVRFDNDPVDFHPGNNGREDTCSFNDFSAMFGTMSLSDYGLWRVLYLGLRPTQAQELDIRSFTPDELAGEEPLHAHASEIDTVEAGSIMQRLRAAWTDTDGSHPGFNAVRFSQHKFCPLSGSCPAAGITPLAGTEIVEVMADANWTEIDDCLRHFPVFFIHTGITHDEIPLRYLPHLLNTAATL